jgi:NAD(P)-dependent dehydrogenase (short-subunit alcohol dehydrogenase family)
MKRVVITGASTGIGWGTTRVLLDKGLRVFGSVRRTEDAARLAAEFGERFTPLLFDVTDTKAVQAEAERVRAELKGETLFGLVNNAGIAVPGPLLHLPIDDFRRQIEVNLIAQVAVTQAFLPLLGTDRTLSGAPGRVVNISSVGGRNGAPFLGPYAASKHALEGFSESLRRELMLYGIDVIIVAPGAIVTPIWDKGEQAAITPYLDTEYVPALKIVQKFMVSTGRRGLPPEKVGQVIWTALTSARPKVRYAVLPNPFSNFIRDLLPRRMVDNIIARGLGFKPGPRK